MTTHILSTNSTTGINTVASGDRWIVEAGVTISVSDDDAFFGYQRFTGNTFNIAGTVQTTGSFYSFLMRGDDTRITVGQTGVVTSENIAVWTRGDTSWVFNDGLIDATNFATRFVGNKGHLRNSGTITSDNTAVYMSGELSDINNSGTISGLVGINSNAASGTMFNLINTGTIEGSKYAVVGSAARQMITNEGTIKGDVYLRDGADLFVSNGGSVTNGSVFGGNGNDTYTIDSASIALVETEAGGIDQVNSSVTYALGAYFENLTLTGSSEINGTGNSASNVITGNAFANRLKGLAAADTLSGGNGWDRLFGGQGKDTLNGEAGKDVLKGGSGADILNGGKGNDVMTGGPGTDTFVFNPRDGADRVTDFSATGTNHDFLDISSIGAITGFQDLKNHHMVQSGTDVVITYPSASITLENVNIADLSKEDFLF